MRKRVVYFTIVTVVSALQLLYAERYARYNYVGYFTNAPKRLVVMADNSCTGESWELKDKAGKSVLQGVVGESLVGKGDYTPLAFNYEIDFTSLATEGTYSFVMKGVQNVTLTVSNNPYKNAVQSNLRWLRVSRSGTNTCLDHVPTHYGDSSSYVYRRKGPNNKDVWEEDKNGKKVNMLGGWYDGYVYTKFTSSIAYTVYFLLRSYEVNPSLFEKKYSTTDLIDILDEAKFGLDYLLKTMPDDNEFIIQTGGFADNESGTRLPEEDKLDGKRESYSIFSPTQMGYTAAALALGSVTFESVGKKRICRKI